MEEKMALDKSNNKFDSMTILSLTSEINNWQDTVNAVSNFVVYVVFFINQRFSFFSWRYLEKK